MRYYRTVADAWRRTVAAVLASGNDVPGMLAPSSPGAGRGSRELVADAFEVADPRARTVVSAARPLNHAFPVGAFLYCLAGRDDVAAMEYYNPAAPRFSDDGRTLRGSYGPSVRFALPIIVDLLRADRSTRRAVLPTFGLGDLLEDSRDVPCSLSMQFLARGGRLEAVVTFRSQNAYALLPYDAALFTLLHEHVATQAWLALGAYRQVTGSMHVYDDEADAARGVIVEDVEESDSGSDGAWPSMTHLEPKQLEAMLIVEGEERRRGLGGDEPDDDGAYENALVLLDPYWLALCRYLAAFADARLSGSRHLRDENVLFDCFVAEGCW